MSNDLINSLIIAFITLLITDMINHVMNDLITHVLNDLLTIVLLHHWRYMHPCSKALLCGLLSFPSRGKCRN
jgi:hypothetical protein